jgi:hypothetical protein
MSKELDTIAITVESIKNDNLTVLDDVLRVMPIEKLKDTNQENLLSTFLALCAENDRKDAAKLILERWDVVYPDNDKIPILPRLFINNKFDIFILSFLVSIFNDVTFVEIMDDLSEWDVSPNVVTACSKADQIFGPQPLKTYELVRDNAIEHKNYVVEDYMIDKILEIAPFSPKPEYVKNYIGEHFEIYKNKLPTEKELEGLAERESKKETDLEGIILPSDDEAVEMLTQGLTRNGISIEEIDEAKKLLKEEISKSEERKRELLLPIIKNDKEQNLDSDRLLYWIFGPSNPLIAQNLTLNTPSAKYGGCRMFLTDLFDYDEEFGYVADWFTGNCEKCLLRIKHRWYAVRLPRVHGGWEGCFCSWKCVKERLNDIETDQMQPEILRHQLIEAFETKTNQVGIQDRI